MSPPQQSNFWFFVVAAVVTLLLLPYLGIRILGSDYGVEQDTDTPNSHSQGELRQPTRSAVEEPPHEDVW